MRIAGLVVEDAEFLVIHSNRDGRTKMRMDLVFRHAIGPRSLSDFADSHGWIFQGHHPAVGDAPEELTWMISAGIGARLI